MNSLQNRRKVNKKQPSKRKSTQELPTSFNIKLFVSMGLLLVILLMKKYDLSVGNFNVDSIYSGVYHNEDLSGIRDKIFFFDQNDAKDAINQTTEATEDTSDALN